MEKENHRRNTWFNTSKQAMGIFMLLVFLVVGVVTIFLQFFNNYNAEILYEERLNQMQEVTEQLFSGLEDVVDVQWDNARYQSNYLKKNKPETVDELLSIMQEQVSVGELEKKKCNLIAIDAQGRYYYQDGKQGLLDDMSYLNGRPAQISYVLSNMTTSKAEMLFLYRLDEPVVLQDGSRTVKIIYYGVAENMEQLNPYFDCKAYGGNNSTYVTDTNGLKLFAGKSGTDLLKGINIFSDLRNMSYQHNLTFDDTLQTMQQKGLAYSNAILEGEEYYYAMYQMENVEWVLVFLVPSSYVAVNTVYLVETTTRLLLGFAIVMTVVCAVLIYMILRIQQQKALKIVNDTNAILKANNERLEQAQAETTKALQTAEKASKAKTEFLANMSHDIRTPMNAIVGITRLMAHDKSDPEKMNIYIEKVQMSSQHLLSLINDVLDMSKIESSDVVLNKELINLADQVSQVDSIVRPQIEDRKHKFTIHTRNITHEHLIGDAVRLRQVMINLLSNAIKYTPNGGTICFDLEELPCDIPGYAKLRISVTDSGYGMKPEFVEHIFEPFVRAENSTTNRVQGTGLGMAITKNIVDLAGGTIKVKSEVGKGSCFTVEIPMEIDHETKTTLNIQSVMLVTDDEEFIHNVQIAFQETDIALFVAGSAAEVDEILTKNPVDIALLGSHLNGQRLLDHIKNLREKAGSTRLIYCCDYNEHDQLSDITRNGKVDGVLTRPIFLSDVAHAMERTKNETEEIGESNISVLNGMRFLCAEDNDLNAEILHAVLDMNGAGCVIYPDGQKIVEAFKTVKPGEFDAILMDVQMPVMNGMDATREIRKSENPLGKTIPIIAMTANAFSEDVQNCLNAGMDAHIPKPLDIATLERTMKSFINGKFSGGGQLSARQRQKVDHIRMSPIEKSSLNDKIELS